MDHYCPNCGRRRVWHEGERGWVDFQCQRCGMRFDSEHQVEQLSIIRTQREEIREFKEQ